MGESTLNNLFLATFVIFTIFTKLVATRTPRLSMARTPRHSKPQRIWFHRFRVQTFANVVHATGGEDRTPRRTHIFLSVVSVGHRYPSHAHACGSRFHRSCVALRTSLKSLPLTACFINHSSTSRSQKSRRPLAGKRILWKPAVSRCTDRRKHSRKRKTICGRFRADSSRWRYAGGGEPRVCCYGSSGWSWLLVGCRLTRLQRRRRT